MRITTHNVGRGAAVLIELPPQKGVPNPVGIVDCFCGHAKEQPLLNELLCLDSGGDLTIEFLVITHFHADHFLGVSEILSRYGSRIKRYYDPGLNLRHIMSKDFDSTQAPDTRARADLKAIEKFQAAYPVKVYSLTSPDLRIYDDLENGVSIRSVAPNGAMLSSVAQRLKLYVQEGGKEASFVDAANKVLDRYDPNQASSALQIIYQDTSIVLGGDVLVKAWDLVVKSGLRFEADAFLLSHHGSADAFPAKHWDQIASSEMDTIVSGYGTGQPATSVFDFLRRSGNKLWVTNVPKDLPSDELHDYTISAHYNREAVSTVREGNVVCYISDGLKVEGPRIL